MRSAWERSADGKRTDLAGALSEVGRHLKRRSVVCVLSDFMSEGNYARELAILSRRHRVNCFLVHDPLEAVLPGLGLVEVEDSETGQRQIVDLGRLAAKESVDARLRSLRRLGVKCSAVGTDDDPFQHLLQHFRRLEQSR